MIKVKSDAIGNISLFFQTLVIPTTRLRLERLQTDKGGESTGKAFQDDSLQTGIKQEFAATNTPPRQIGAIKAAGGRPPELYAASL